MPRRRCSRTSRRNPIGCSAADIARTVGAFGRAWARRPSGAVALAVSGGSDSVALLRLVAASGARPPVLTVDHGLRAESRREAEWVGRLCADLGLAHTILTWADRPAGGNLQAAAREARHRLFADWARPKGIETIATGHTQDDQAETVLMRLARGSGVDGLAAMRERAERPGLTTFRPLLGLARAELRRYLEALGQDWVEDPSNADRRFDRVKAREILNEHALGLSPHRLARTAEHMARAADALEIMLADWSARHLRLPETGEAVVPRPAFAALPEELRLRLLARCLSVTAGRVYRPRFAALSELAVRLADGGAARTSLHGCLVRADREVILILREPAAAAAPVPIGPDGVVWDGRWRILPPAGAPAGLLAGAIGEAGLAALDPDLTPPEWRSAPRLARLTAPAIWDGTRLVAAPLAGPLAAAGWRAERAFPDCNRPEGSLDGRSAV